MEFLIGILVHTIQLYQYSKEENVTLITLMHFVNHTIASCVSVDISGREVSVRVSVDVFSYRGEIVWANEQNCRCTF